MRYLSVVVVLILPAMLYGQRHSVDEQAYRLFLKNYCLDCHGSTAPEADLDLETLASDFQDTESFSLGVKIHDRLRDHEMPPADSDQPSADEHRMVLSWLFDQLEERSVATRTAEGRAVLRRLNRTEYENTLRDLFDLPGLSVRDLLPEDSEAFGFDKSGVGLDLSYVQLARYMEAAEVALDAAIAPHAGSPAFFQAHIPAGGCQAFFAQAFRGPTVFLRDFKYDDSLIPIPQKMVEGKDERARKLRRENLKDAYDGSIGVFVPEGVGAFKPRIPFRVVYPGHYKLRMSVWSFIWDKGEVKANTRTESALLSAEGRTLGYFDAPSLAPTVTEIEVWLNPMKTARDEILFNAASLWPAGPVKGNVANYTGPGIAVDWIEIEGPFLNGWPTESHRRLFGDLPMQSLPPMPKHRGSKPPPREPAGGDIHNPKRPPENAFVIAGHGKPFIEGIEQLPQRFTYSTVLSNEPVADARRLLTEFLPRVFRRPVSEHDLDRYVSLIQSRLEMGDTFEVAMRMAFKAALCSPEFLFVQVSPGSHDAYGLAERLSYFLWNSMPDAELFELAREDRLREPDVLYGQVERMLADPKSERFVVDFTDQWLDLSEIDATTPDGKLYPEYRVNLRDAMRAETPRFFRELLEQDLPASNIVDSDFAVLNQRLAEHYGVPGVVGAEMRRVELPDDCRRGGFITQASILKVTANGTTTSPVTRGAWVMRRIIGRPPDPPPSGVPAIEPDVTGTTTVREMLEAHRANESCAACHARIDPPGFALEHFDVIGGWQTRYRTLNEDGDPVDKSDTYSGRRVAYKWGPPVDASGFLPDGRPFDNFDDFQRLLLRDRRAIARNLVAQLVTYATGAPIEFADRAAVEAVLDRAKVEDADYGTRKLLHGIVQSPLFQTK